MTTEFSPVFSGEINLPAEYPYPYVPETFTGEEGIILSHFFTNIDKPVFAIHNLPQEVVGALFSRYSRTNKSIRRVFLDEFYEGSELSGDSLKVAKGKSQDFYKKVFTGFGDDSIIQMGSVHVASEFVSQIAAKAIEDQRIGAAYIEKSTRYVKFTSRDKNGHFLFAEVPEIMKSKLAEEFLLWNNSLFGAYTKHLPTTVELFRKKYPLEDQVFVDLKSRQELKLALMTKDEDRQKAKRAYESAVTAKALDTIRVFLPATTVTNLGAHFSGQAAENAINKMLSSPHSEVRLLGAMAYEELQKVASSFLRNINHPYGRTQRDFLRESLAAQERVSLSWLKGVKEKVDAEPVRLVDWDKDADVKIASQILYKNQPPGQSLSKEAIVDWCRAVKEKDNSVLPRIILESVPDRKAGGRTRRQKLPRAFEQADAEVEFYLDFGVFRDLQRNRLSSTERQALSAEKVHIPEEFYEPGMEEVLRDYLQLSQKTRDLNAKIRLSGDPLLAEAAEYVTIFGNKLRFNVRANIRQWVFFAELRTIEGGHTTYRNALQSAARQIIEKMPFLEPLFAHVNWKKDCGLGRLGAEFKIQDSFGYL